MRTERPISSVVGDIVDNIRSIVHSELRLAKTELSDQLRKASSAAVVIGAGALLLIFSTLFALLALVYALSLLVPAWAAALIVAVGVGVIAALCVSAGIKKLKTVRAAPRTAATLKENVEWAKQLSR